MQASWDDPFTTYLHRFRSLDGDARTWTTLTETVKGIIAAGSVVCQRIAAQSPCLVAGAVGGWVPHGERRPDKITLTREVRRLLEMLATEAILTSYGKEHGALPPQLAALLHGWHPPDEL